MNTTTGKSATVELCRELIMRPSVTPDDQGCQKMLAELLVKHGFDNEHLRFDDVDNLWSRRGKDGPLMVFAGHTDVVPTGDETSWSHPPFAAEIEGDTLYGRGAADMKGGVAAMITAATRFCDKHPGHNGSIAFLLTSDEEGPAINGTRKVIETLQARSEQIDWCIVGEPSSTKTLGDVVRNGRRGSLGGNLTVHGKQGHVAYPHLARNPIHLVLAALDKLVATKWDEGNEFFPATSFQISNIRAGTGASNVIPADINVRFNLRFSSELTADDIKARVEQILKDYDFDYALDWNLSGNPFITTPAELTAATLASIADVCKTESVLDTGGGTSDGRFIAPTGAQVIEFGPCNESIHSIDENVSCKELDTLTSVYENILERLLLQ